jgi:hypothetical protein
MTQQLAGYRGPVGSAKLYRHRRGTRRIVSIAARYGGRTAFYGGSSAGMIGIVARRRVMAESAAR